jgi:Leucine-rich repeat (LRR) protein
MKFIADNIEYWSQNGIETLLLGSSQHELALLLSSIPATEDHYLEWNDQSNACNNAVESIALTRRQLSIALTSGAAERLGVNDFTIDFDIEERLYKEVVRSLTVIFGEKLAVKKSGTRQANVSVKKDYSTIKYLNLEGKNLRELPDYVREMTALETAKLSRNPQLDFSAVCDVLSKLPSVRELSFTTTQAVPENIGALVGLETLSLDGFNSPQVLPDSFGQLKKLKYLLLMSDSEVILPESFAGLTALEHLYMRAPIWRLPSGFYQLKALKILDFSNCRLDRLPEEMTGMTELDTVHFSTPEERDYPQILSVLANMPNLRSLELCTNPVPKEIGLCKQITELKIWTGFEATSSLQLPDELFGLTQLKSLIFNMCRFEKIPANIGKLISLEELVFMESDFEELPDSVGELRHLTYLNISENPSLRTLPDSIGDLVQLKTLCLADNPLLTRLPDGCKKLTNLESVTLIDRESVENVPETWGRHFT